MIFVILFTLAQFHCQSKITQKNKLLANLWDTSKKYNPTSLPIKQIRIVFSGFALSGQATNWNFKWIHKLQGKCLNIVIESSFRFSLWIKVLCLFHFWRWSSTWHRSLCYILDKYLKFLELPRQNCVDFSKITKKKESGKCPEPSTTWWRGLAGGYCHSGWLAAPRLATTRDRSGAPRLPPWPCVTPPTRAPPQP